MKKRILIILCMFISNGLFSQADFFIIIESALEKGEKNISIPMGTYTLMSEDYESVSLKDLKADPQQRNDLHAQYPENMSNMNRQIHEWLKMCREPMTSQQQDYRELLMETKYEKN